MYLDSFLMNADITNFNLLPGHNNYILELISREKDASVKLELGQFEGIRSYLKVMFKPSYSIQHTGIYVLNSSNWIDWFFKKRAIGNDGTKFFHVIFIGENKCFELLLNEVSYLNFVKRNKIVLNQSP